jgi:hypothetical protein
VIEEHTETTARVIKTGSTAVTVVLTGGEDMIVLRGGEEMIVPIEGGEGHLETGARSEDEVDSMTGAVALQIGMIVGSDRGAEISLCRGRTMRERSSGSLPTDRPVWTRLVS